MAEMELHEGQWRSAVPLPLYSLMHVRCWECGRRFWGLMNGRKIKNFPAFRRYEVHYRSEHIPAET